MHQSKSFALKDLYKAVRRIENLWFNVVFARDLFVSLMFSAVKPYPLWAGGPGTPVCLSRPTKTRQHVHNDMTNDWCPFFNFKVFQLGVDNALVVLHRYFSWQSLNDQSFLFASDGMHDSWQVIMKAPVTFHMNRKSLPSWVCVCVSVCWLDEALFTWDFKLLGSANRSDVAFKSWRLQQNTRSCQNDSKRQNHLEMILRYSMYNYTYQ